jgi:hypothetical protein
MPEFEIYSEMARVSMERGIDALNIASHEVTRSHGDTDLGV